jgi:hypothetical protein
MPKKQRAMPGKVKNSFNQQGKGNQYCALTRTAVMNGYETVDVNDDLCPEPQYCARLT